MSDQNEQLGYEDGYSGYADSDYLDAAKNLTMEIKQQTYALMRVREGQTVLDVGCGPASDTIPLSKIVRATGKVIGIDHDAEMVATADQRATDEGVASIVEHRHANGLELPFEDNTFDSCRSERVFQHVAEAETLLTEMIRVTKPGGYIVIADADHSTHGTSTQFPDMDLRLRQTLLQRNANPQVIRRLYTMMTLAGLQAIETAPYLVTSNDYHVWWMLVGQLVLPQALELGIWTDAEVEQYRNELENLHEQGAFYAHTGYLLIAGRKPE